MIDIYYLKCRVLVVSSKSGRVNSYLKLKAAAQPERV